MSVSRTVKILPPFIVSEGVPQIYNRTDSIGCKWEIENMGKFEEYVVNVQCFFEKVVAVLNFIKLILGKSKGIG